MREENQIAAGGSADASEAQGQSGRRKFLALAAAAIVLLALAAVIVPILISTIAIADAGFRIKDRLQPALGAIDLKEWQKIKTDLAETQADLLSIEKDLGGLGPILYWPAVGKSVKTARIMINTSVDLLAGYGQIFVILDKVQKDSSLDKVAIGFSSPEQKKNFLNIINQNQEELALAKQKVEQAKTKLEQIYTNDYAGLGQSQLMKLNDILSAAVYQSDMALPLISRLPQLTGAGQEKNYLFVFQNNMELRPTGGFIGSYGLLTLRDGEIKNFLIDDIYNLDKQSEGKLKIPAPEPMVRYNNQKYWYFRDANWSPDWPTTARQLLWFFDAERKNAQLPPQKFDGVIALTPDFIANILEVTGPVTVQGVTFTKDNFAMELEQFVEFEYVGRGISKESRKSIMGPLSQILIAKMEQMPAGDLIKLWSAFSENINEKNILVYLQDQELENYFLSQNWSGAVKQVDYDYLMVIDSNLAALKTDSVMTKGLLYSLKASSSGDLIAHLEINYRHNSQPVRNLITRYRTYVRIYVPQDSWFIQAYAVDSQGRVDLPLGQDFNFGDELGKKYGAAFIEVQPQMEKKLIVEYRLPDRIKQQYQDGAYRLLIQKQPGTVGHNLKIDLNFNKYLNAYRSENLPAALSGQHIGWDTNLDTDKEFSIKF